MTFLIALVHTEIEIKLNLDSPVHEEYVSLNLMFALHKCFMSFWALMDNVVEIKLIIVALKLTQPCSSSTWRSARKALYLNGFASS